MSDTDSFIQEVTEEVRQDRMFRLWKRYAPYVIGAIVLLVGAAAFWNWQQHRAVIEARERGAAFLEAEITSVEAQQSLTEAMRGEASEAVAEMRLAAAKLANDDREGAASIYHRLALRADLSPAWRKLALLLALKLDAATGDPAELIAALGPLTEEASAYRPLALELRGVLELNSGDLDAARADLSAAMSDPLATGETRRRAMELLAAVGPGGEG